MRPPARRTTCVIGDNRDKEHAHRLYSSGDPRLPLLGYLLHHAAANLIGLATLPLFAWALGQPPAVIAAGATMFLIVSLKRLEANREPLPPGKERWQVLKRRWLLDRDVEDWETWISRRPERAPPSWRMAKSRSEKSAVAAPGRREEVR